MNTCAIREFKNIQASVVLFMIGFSCVIDSLAGLSAWIIRREEYSGWMLMVLGVVPMIIGLTMFKKSKKKILDLLSDKNTD